jgi:hypothetical protein
MLADRLCECKAAPQARFLSLHSRGDGNGRLQYDCDADTVVLLLPSPQSLMECLPGTTLVMREGQVYGSSSVDAVTVGSCRLELHN